MTAEPRAVTVVTVLHQIGSKMPSSEAEIAALRTKLMPRRIPFRERRRRSSTACSIVATLAMLSPVLPMDRTSATTRDEDGADGFRGWRCGWILPRFLLEKKVAKRQEKLRLSLPDALDLMVVSVEAGLGLDQAMQHVASELQWSHPELSEELSLVTLEMRAGKRRADALRNLAERTGEAEDPQAGGHPDSERPLRHQHGRESCAPIPISCACAAGRRPRSAPARWA